MPELAWTRELPTKPGFYAWRDDGDRALLAVIECNGALIVEDTEAATVPLYGWINVGEWLGPLPE